MPRVIVDVAAIVFVFVLFVCLLVAAFHHTIQKHFNFLGGCAPQGPLQGTLSPVNPLAYGMKV